MTTICHSERSEESLRDAKIISLQSLTLFNFRNYEYARMEISPSPVVLTGENGAGKTNILEAVSLLTIGRGLRRAKLSEIDKLTPNPQSPTSNPWAISANLIGRLGEVKIGTGRDGESIENTDKRIVKIDGKLVKGQAELSRHTSMIWLTPQMEQLFGESASAGRKFLDRLVFSFDTDHASRINEYDYAMRERNKLLALGRGDKIWLDALEQTMAETASATALARITTADHINHTIASSPLSFPKAFVEARGFVEDLLKAGSSALEAENGLKTALADGRGRDGAAGRTLIGTHRSELCVTHLGKNMPAGSCSMGEQKAMMLSIILAQARAGSQWHGVTPIILLDEVAGHLDAVKRSELFEEITEIKAQVWMTGTDFSQFADLQGKAQFFKVEKNSAIQA